MSIKDKTQVKVFLSEKAHDALKRAKDTRGDSHSKTVEDMIVEVLIPELDTEAAGLDERVY